MAESEPLLQEKMEVPHSTFTLAKPDRRGRILPQAIAHRGYKAANPENTMGAFRGAVEVGAHAIETDLHISKDGVLLISHDPSLKRCFGKDEKIIDCDWSYISTLRTVQAPHESMPRLRDLLEYLATPGLEDIWILLDIKVSLPYVLQFSEGNSADESQKLDNNADQIMSLIASTIKEVEPTRPWNQRILLGCWAAKYIPLCAIYLPDFPITHIGFSIGYARQFLSVPNINFNILRQILVGPGGSKFLADTRDAKRSMFVWTVNEEQWMRWSIENEVDGVVTDDPKKYLEVCEEYDPANPNKVAFGLKDWMLICNKSSTEAHYLVDCRKCQGQERDNFVVLWVERENGFDFDSGIVDAEKGTWKKGADNNFMLGIGRFDIVTNGNQRGREKSVRVYQDGTEEARREKKGLRNASPDIYATNMARFDAGSNDDVSNLGAYRQTNEGAYDSEPDAPRAQSFPAKSKSRIPNVFGSLKKMIVRPKSEQDTGATGENKLPAAQSHVKQGLNRSNTTAGILRGGKKIEGQDENIYLSGLTDDRRIDDATGYVYITPREAIDLHFQGVVAGSGGAETAISKTTSAPIDIPQNRRTHESNSEWHARRYRNDIASSPFADEYEIHDAENSHHRRTNPTNTHATPAPSERRTQDTHSSRPRKISRETEFSQSDKARLERIITSSDGDTLNLTPHNIGDVLAVLKGNFGTSLPSSSFHISPRHHVVDRPVHSRSTEALSMPIPEPFRPHALDHPGHSQSIEASPVPIPPRHHAVDHLVHSQSIEASPVPIPPRPHALHPQGLSASLPYTRGSEERVEGAQWMQGNVLEKVPSAPSQHTTTFVEPPRRDNAPNRNNTTKKPSWSFALPKRSNTADVIHPRHPLSNQVTRSTTLDDVSQKQTRNNPVLPNIQEPLQETIPGPRYSTIPISPPVSPKNSEKGWQSARHRNKLSTPASKPEPCTNLLVQDQAPVNDRSSIMTTFSQFIPSRNEELDEEIATSGVPAKISRKASRRRLFGPNSENQTRNQKISEVPAIPKTYANNTRVLPKIGRDVTGRFSVEHIEQEQPGVVLHYGDEGVSVKVSVEVPVEVPSEVPADMDENHTKGTWAVALGIKTADVSPCSSVEDLNGAMSPISPLGGLEDGRGWSDDGGGKVCLSSETCQLERESLPGQSYPLRASPPPPPGFPSAFSSIPPPNFPQPPPQPPHPPPPPFDPPQIPPPQSQSQPHPFQHEPPTYTSFLPTSTDTQPHIDPTMPIIRPLQIRKNKNIRPPVPATEEDPREIHIRRRQKEQLEEEFRKADERLRALRDGRYERGGL
ncbi:hypothetical protein SBOR_2780 [Sclerotinia borealis F-4128]|uniref:GP-PDE domain-containing protein n=1 Tax=Sclerotinia borealis (strain F-4128) TaxID=1432307 RepID=W9CQH9_SCLBF|nr:hypothetical protein SBOR_2780 [Sclerotinia borealis F-4128]